MAHHPLLLSLPPSVSSLCLKHTHTHTHNPLFFPPTHTLPSVSGGGVSHFLSRGGDENSSHSRQRCDPCSRLAKAALSCRPLRGPLHRHRYRYATLRYSVE